jgi:hypothetical protein
MKREIGEISSEASTSDISQKRQKEQVAFSSLVTSVNVDKFRDLLIRWIIQDQIPFSAVESTAFREMILYIAPSLSRYLIRSHATMSQWIKDDYQEARQRLKQRLASSQSKIHFSFDPWTSPASDPIIGICAHFLGPNLTLESPLVSMKVIEGSHTGATLGEIVLRLIRELEIDAERVGVYVADNAANMTSTVRYLIKELHPDEVRGERDEPPRRSRCLGHIINLAAQSFLFGPDFEAFAEEIRVIEEVSSRNEDNSSEQGKWRQKGVIGKFHNIVKWIRDSSQRRQTFKSVINGIISEKRANG